MGEFELLAKLRERLPEAGARVRVGMGDDAAITAPEGATVTSVDALVDDVHFRRSQATVAQIGRNALAAAAGAAAVHLPRGQATWPRRGERARGGRLSDLAAMGAEPGGSYVTLGV